MPESEPIDPRLEAAIGEIREVQVDPSVLDAAAARVWSRVARAAQSHPVERIRSCADFQALMPDYRAGRLPEARALLLEDHTHECVACRKALGNSGKPAVVAAIAPARKQTSPFPPWAIAAAVLMAGGISLWTLRDRFVGAGADGGVMVEAARGMLLRVSDRSSSVLLSGQALPSGAEIRSTRDSDGLLRLNDGSMVEMRERSAFTVSESGKDLTIHLSRGSIIVQAAKRSAGHLYVATHDCRVSVTGTVFSVNSGVKGSRVSVIEGEVRVRPDNAPEKVLHPGDQFSTNPEMSGVPVNDEISWSRNFSTHAALLKTFGTILRAVQLPGPRYSTRLLDLAPPQTAIYASIPNLGSTLGPARQIFQEKAQQVPELRQWLLQNSVQVDTLIAKMQQASSYLGDEIVILAERNGQGGISPPVILAEVKRPGLKEFIDAEVAQLNHRGPKMLLRPDFAAISPDAAMLRKVATGNFRSTSFHDRIAQVYGAGAGFLLAVDLKRMSMGRANPPMGLENAQYLMLEQKSIGDLTGARAVVTFDGPRTGVASWLAAPAPAGTLDFVSPDAAFACAFVVKSPATIIQELFRWRETIDPNFRARIASIESKLGISVEGDLAASLGGDFTFAVDGPLLPPAWKLAVEVYDPARLQSTIEKIINAFNREMVEQPTKQHKLTQELAGGRTFYTLTVPGLGLMGEMHYTFIDGYLLAAQNRGLLDSAIRSRANGYTLARSQGFVSLLPRDLYPNFSGMVYENAGPAIGSVMALLNLKPQQVGAIGGFSADMKPMLIAAYGDADRITLAGSGNFLAMSSLMDMPRVMMKGTSQGLSALH